MGALFSRSSDSSPIFRIYIGALKGKPDFDDVKEKINPKLKEFDFMLQFARDYVGNENQNGEFNAQWETSTFGLKAIQTIKQFGHKVVVSIGGRDQSFPFPNVSVKDEWVQNATDSMKKLMDDYALDGIDINYGSILVAPEDFSYCMGELINNLVKECEKKIIVSISPTCGNELHYQYLFRYQNQKPFPGEPWIDWINYQFYDLKDAIPTADVFVKKYNEAAEDYCTEKLLLGFSTDPNDMKKLPVYVFFDGIDILITRQHKKLPGVFSWDAAHSYHSYDKHKFRYETTGEEIVVNQ